MAKEFRPKARRPRGFQDRRGAQLAAERALVAKIAAVYEAWGFEGLETSAFEYADCLGKFLPDQDRPNEGVFALEDDDQQWMALRYDLTAPLARFVAENFDALPKPYRRWAAGPVWRNEKPGPGRFREFWQCDADTVGAASPAADAEMIAVACAGLEAAGLKAGQYRININTRRLLNGVLASIGADDPAKRLSVLRAIDKLDRLGVDGVRLLLGKGRRDESGDFTRGAELSEADAERVLAFVTAGRGSREETLSALSAVAANADTEAGLAELGAIDEALGALGIGAAQARFDPGIVRGLEYYTGPVFEAELIGSPDEEENVIRYGSVGGGGRYDDLVARFTGQLVPATGFSIGVSRLAAALQALGEQQADGPVVILALDQTRMGAYLAMAQELRAAGVRAEVYLGQSGMKAQMKYADRRGAPIAVIEGEDEVKKGVVTLKDLKLGAALAKAIEGNEAWRKGRPAQIEAPRAELAAAVKRMLAEGGALAPSN
ncbi:MAG: histidine--tRNA ligase [Hydrogenophilaceae bacterium]|jgi:histidyl-tRNA synthetase|nr:histidine--tRNA ligase [Hydrogenophilaceae bacterium]